MYKIVPITNKTRLVKKSINSSNKSNSNQPSKVVILNDFEEDDN